MKQDDYFLKQIDLLGRILGKIVSDLLKLKSKGEIMESIESITLALKNELDLNLNEILLLDNEDFLKFLQEEKKLNNENLEKLAEILYLMGDNNPTEKRTPLLEKSLLIFEQLNKNSTTYYPERIKKIERINNVLNSK
jgi:hypothetical protein